MSIIRTSARLEPELELKLQTLMGEQWVTGTRSNNADFLAAGEVDESVLGSRLQATMVELEQSRQDRAALEAESRAKSVQLQAEVSRLRCEVEGLRHDLEVHHSRSDSDLDRRRHRAIEEKVLEVGRELLAAHARRNFIALDVAKAPSERALNAAHISELESELASHAVERVRMESQLRLSEVRQAEMRRQLAEATAKLRATDLKSAASGVFFASIVDDEPGETGDSPLRNRGMSGCDSDLESCYEGLDSLNLDGVSGNVETVIERDVRDPGVGDHGGGVGGSSDDTYQAPLKALESVLARIRDSQQATSSAGTGETLENIAEMDSPLESLQNTLALLLPSQSASDNVRETPVKEGPVRASDPSAATMDAPSLAALRPRMSSSEFSERRFKPAPIDVKEDTSDTCKEKGAHKPKGERCERPTYAAVGPYSSGGAMDDVSLRNDMSVANDKKAAAGVQEPPSPVSPFLSFGYGRFSPYAAVLGRHMGTKTCE
eukprot:TRINITY_DN29964_c0_g5_i1.p1 TRINITY_DN29964_c0_g5~~TRINITY_DN29964_c0_g5_i1.p1  ORF type:complete len:491 (-),score=76.03 TRINITY_DN29964_c0_g5_i1:45-1517(-)